MKITLIVPAKSIKKDIFNIPSPNLGILYLAACLEKNGFDVEIIDIPLIKQKCKKINDELLLEIIRDTAPDLIGFTTSCDNYPFTILLSKKLKKYLNIPIVLGGVQATHTAMDTMKAFPWIDIIVKYEGEETIVDLVKTLKNNKSLKDVKGIVYRMDGKIYETPPRRFIKDLNKLPFPAFHLLPNLKEYVLMESQSISVPIITARGCPFNCTYCSVSTMWKRTPRFRSPENILKEIRYIRKSQKIEMIYFLDDTFTLHRDRVVRICNLIKKENVKFSILSRIDTIDEKLLEKLKASGCCRIFYGIESGSMKTLRDMKKTADTNFIKRANEIVKKTLDLGIECVPSFIIGFPDETIKEANKTIKLAFKFNKMGANSNIAQLAPLPGSEIYEKYKEKLTNLQPVPYNYSSDFEKKYKEMIANYPKIFSPFYTLNLLIARHFLNTDIRFLYE